MLKTLGYIVRRGIAWLKRRLVALAASCQRQRLALPFASTLSSEILPYAHWLAQRITDRKVDYPPVVKKKLFSIITPVFDPPAGFFRVLGKSIFAQDHQDWQWVIVDNGCRQPDVLYLLEKFARDPRVKLVRAPKALGIIGGMRLALEHANHRYVCPVDHDDRLYPDALRVVAASLQALNWPALAYSDEDKLIGDGSHASPFFKPDWDPLFFLNCCYVAHLGIMDRLTTLELGVYTDAQAEGTPDGDAFCRFVAAGHKPQHIPEVLYSWRMHPQSTALLGIAAKPYVVTSQKHVLDGHLEQLSCAQQVCVRTNPLPGIPGTWRVAPVGLPRPTQGGKVGVGDGTVNRLKPEFQFDQLAIPLLLGPGGSDSVRKMVLDRLALCSDITPIHCLDGRPEALLEALLQFPDESWLVLLDPHHLPLTRDFVQEFDCVQRVVPDAIAVGGIILDQEQQVESAGLVWGFEGILGSPLHGYDFENAYPGASTLLFQHCTSAVSSQFFFAQVGFLRSVVQERLLDFGDPLLPAWLGYYAAQQGKRILFTPYVRSQRITELLPRPVSSLEEFRFLSECAELLRYDPYYSSFYGLTQEYAYQAVRPDLRAKFLNKCLGILTGTHPELSSLLISADRYTSPLIQMQEQLKRKETHVGRECTWPGIADRAVMAKRVVVTEVRSSNDVK